MDVVVERQWKKETYSVGIMYINGNKFCNTMEDKDRGLDDSMSVEEITAKKVYGETAIPRGTYNVVMSYSNRFKKYLPEIQNVKGFSGIRIHSGNTAKDSSGCLLLGKNTQVGMVTNSREYCSTFNKMLEDALKRKEKVTIVIR